jgi:glycosyltransferase involved in cell wall biosynthesis
MNGMPSHLVTPEHRQNVGQPRQTRCLISVITIVYNNCAGFQTTARSVIEQCVEDFEWIVIDGGSTDGTVETIRSVEDRITSWCSERDGGIYDAMNKGLQKANGRFLVYMNSGDAFAASDSLEKVCKALDGADDDVAMVICGARFELPEGRSYDQLPRQIDSYISHSLPTSHQAIFFRTDLHRQTPFDLSFKIAADYDALCRLYKTNGKSVYLDDVIAIVWRGLDSNSLRFPIRNAVEMATTQRRVLGMGAMDIFLSGARRMMPVVAFRLLSYRWTAQITYRVITSLRPKVDAAQPRDRTTPSPLSTN